MAERMRRWKRGRAPPPPPTTTAATTIISSQEVTPTSEGSHCRGWTLPNFQFGSSFCSTIWTCSLSQLFRLMTYRHYISWKHRLWRASGDRGEYLTRSMCSMAAVAAQIRTGRAGPELWGGTWRSRQPGCRPRGGRERSTDAHAKLRPLWPGRHERK